jgi:hypothetical protein
VDVMGRIVRSGELKLLSNMRQSFVLDTKIS